MIVKNLHAKHFMRYEELSLTHLPESGLVAILGENESGKSTIGECITFALFGQTVRTSLDGRDDKTVINWKEDACEVALDFVTDTGNLYRVVRQLDRSGTRQAELTKLPDGESVAKGLAAVAEQIKRLIGITFDEFRYSFYLAQNELHRIRRGSGEDRQRALYNMLGITEVEDAIEETRTTLDELMDSREKILSDQLLCDRLTASYEGESERLSQTRNTIGRLDKEATSRQQTIAKVEHGTEAAKEALGARQQALTAFKDLRNGVTYAYHVGRAGRDWAELSGLRTAMENAREQLKTDYIAKSCELEELHTHLQDGQKLNDQLVHLEELVSLHGATTKENLKRAGRNAVRQDYLLSDSEREKLSVAEARIRRRTTRLKRRRLKAYAAALAGAGAVALSVVCHLQINKGGFTFGSETDPTHTALIASAIGGVGLFLFVLSGWIAVRVKTGTRRLGSLLETRKTLWDKIETLKRSMQAAEQFSTDNSAAILTAVNDIRDEGVRSFYRTLRDEYPAFFKDGHRHDLDALTKQEQAAAEALETIKDTAVHYKHIINVLDKRLPIIQGIIGEEATPSKAEKRKITNPEQTEARAAELLERCAVSLKIIGSLTADSDPNWALPEQSLVTKIVTSVNRLAASDPDPNGQANALRQFQDRTALGKLVQDWQSMDEKELDDAIAAEAALLHQALPSEKELGARVENCSDQMITASSTLAATVARKDALAESLAVYAPRVEKEKSLTVQTGELNQQLEQVEDDIELQTTLVDLLEGTAASMKSRLGPGIAREVERVLPKITRGRYDRVEVNDRLEILLHSPDKKGSEEPLVHVADLSGGAADQLLIALRLALSRALLRARGHNGGAGQFLFFDEPIASFDAERATNFIQMLQDFSPTFRQIFLVSHNEEIARDANRWATAIITTNPKSRKLIVE